MRSNLSSHGCNTEHFEPVYFDTFGPCGHVSNVIMHNYNI